jgi:PadR family transcriptional regulator PadR
MTVRREIEERTGRNISIGAVYTTLERLEAKGYVSSGATLSFTQPGRTLGA